MDGFVPGLREGVLSLNETLRVVVYFVCVAGLVLRIHRARADLESIVRPVLRAGCVVAMVATMPAWFGYGEKVFLSVAETVRAGYAEHPMQAAALIRERTTESGSAFSLRRLEESYFRAMLWAAAKMIILLVMILQLPFLLLQHILKLLCLLFLPVVLGLFMVPALESLAVRYLQQTCAVLAWPVGFAVTELVAYQLATSLDQNLMNALGGGNGQLDPSSMASLLGGLFAAVWLFVGTIATPVLMQMLFCSGSPLSFGGQSGLTAVAGVHQVLLLASMAKSGGTTAVLAAGRGALQSAGAPQSPVLDGPPKARTSI